MPSSSFEASRGIVFRQHAEGLHLRLRGSVEHTLNFPAGALEVQLPEDLDFPAHGKLIVSMLPTTASADVPEQYLDVHFGEAARAGQEAGYVDLDERRLHIAPVPAGQYRIDIKLKDYDAKWEQLGTDTEGQPIWGRKPVYCGACTLTIPDGGVGRAQIE